MVALHGDRDHILARVEDTEGRVYKHAHEITKLKKQVKNLQMEQMWMLYKVEDQENQNRQNKKRVWGLPEAEREDLKSAMYKMFNPLLDRPMEKLLKKERVHRIRKPSRSPKRCNSKIPVLWRQSANLGQDERNIITINIMEQSFKYLQI